MRDKAKNPEQDLVRQGLNWTHLEKAKVNKRICIKSKSVFFLTNVFFWQEEFVSDTLENYTETEISSQNLLVTHRCMEWNFSFLCSNQPSWIWNVRFYSFMFSWEFGLFWGMIRQEERRGDRTKFLLKISYLIFSLDLQFVHDQTCQNGRLSICPHGPNRYVGPGGGGV